MHKPFLFELVTKFKNFDCYYIRPTSVQIECLIYALIRLLTLYFNTVKLWPFTGKVAKKRHLFSFAMSVCCINKSRTSKQMTFDVGKLHLNLLTLFVKTCMHFHVHLRQSAGLQIYFTSISHSIILERNKREHSRKRTVTIWFERGWKRVHYLCCISS
jgi:hypothetical protein